MIMMVCLFLEPLLKISRGRNAVDPIEETAFRIQKQKAYFEFQYHMEGDRKALKSF